MGISEIKLTQSFVTKVDPASRSVTGLFSCAGLIDYVSDVVRPGAFLNSFATIKPLFLWSHNVNEVPTAKVTGVRELGPAQLPSELRELGATGAAEVTRQYLTHERAQASFEAVKAGAMSQMSFGFNIVRMAFGEQAGEKVRFLDEVECLEISDVVFGAMSQTVSDLEQLRKCKVTVGIPRRKSALDAEAQMLAMGWIKPEEAKRVSRLDAGMLYMGAMTPVEYAVKQLYRGANGRH